MKKLITFEMNFEPGENIEDTTVKLLKGWLIDEHKFDVVVSSLYLGEVWSIVIDCYFIPNTEYMYRIQQLAEQLFKRFEIPYTVTME